MIRICFVCLGNICRSPTAEAVFRHLAEREGIADALVIDSAGTGSWHVGESPDRRSRETARQRGFDLGGRARQVTKRDFSTFDYLIAMDRSNRKNLLRMAPDAASRSKVHLFRDFDARSDESSEVPDPYYGGEDGFEQVFDICEAAALGLIAHLRETHGL
jgi:protein-tyrosine phosphatase